jgi:hypothetical protein
MMPTVAQGPSTGIRSVTSQTLGIVVLSSESVEIAGVDCEAVVGRDATEHREADGQRCLGTNCIRQRNRERYVL